MRKSAARYFRNIDYYLLLIPIAATVFGIIAIYSATRGFGTNRFVLVQAAAMGTGLVAFVVASLIDFERLTPLWVGVYVLNLLLQLSLVVFGVEGETGNKSWLRFAGIGIQPAEVGKVLFIFTFSQHITKLKDHLSHLKSVVLLALHLGVLLAVIVLISKDMGMALAYVFIAVVMVFVAGIHWKWMVGLVLGALASTPVLWNFVMDSYHKLRIMVLFDPTLDPAIYYQTAQSKIAIGSGGLLGAGFLSGRQTQFGMLPAKHTDFIFAVIGEEFGLLGCFLILGILSLIILRVFYVSHKADTLFGSLLCTGIGSMLLFQTLLNVLMCVGLMPIIGLTLPFFSYGGSSILTMFTAVGIVAGIRMRAKPTWLR